MKLSLPIFVLLLMLSGCSFEGPDMGKEKNLTWSKVKSPSGRCYEVATLSIWNSNGSFGYMGMSAIPCSEMP